MFASQFNDIVYSITFNVKYKNEHMCIFSPKTTMQEERNPNPNKYKVSVKENKNRHQWLWIKIEPAERAILSKQKIARKQMNMKGFG